MSRATTDLAELATINLHFALAELTTHGDQDSALRALDHIRQALACMEIVAAERRTPPDEAEAEAA